MYLLRLLHLRRVRRRTVTGSFVFILLALIGTAAPLLASPGHTTAMEQGDQEGRGSEGAGRETELTAEPFPAWLPSGGLYGHQKWVPGSNGVDVFLPRGAVILAPVAGLVVQPAEVVHPLPPPIPAVALRGDGGLSFFLGHVRPLVSSGAQVHAGDPLAVIDDPALDQLGSSGPGPSGWQHVDLNVSRQGTFTWYGGDIPASPWLQSTGYEGTLVDQTPGPTGLR